jgi:DNA-binding NtrC family response regulator
LPDRFVASRAKDVEQDRGLPAGMTLQELERQYVRITLAHCKDNKSRAAAMLGISRKALYAKLARMVAPI